jgi:hypothetical protein
MRHVLAPAREDPGDKLVIEGDRVTVVVETVIDPDFLQPINRI